MEFFTPSLFETEVQAPVENVENLTERLAPQVKRFLVDYWQQLTDLNSSRLAVRGDRAEVAEFDAAIEAFTYKMGDLDFSGLDAQVLHTLHTGMANLCEVTLVYTDSVAERLDA